MKSSSFESISIVISKTILAVSVISVFLAFSANLIDGKKDDSFIDSNAYPVEASDFILDNIIPSVGVQNMRLYNEYNYGSYLLYRGIPVFIDSRADLYTPEFNGKMIKKGSYVDGRDIFTDFLNISSLSTDFEKKFDIYGITHVITYANSKLNMIIEKDSRYKILYDDGKFAIYERAVQEEE